MSARPKATLRFVRRTSFSAGVRFADASLSREDNREFYGEASELKGFGYNYRIEAHFEGEVDPLTGMIVNLIDVDRWLKELTSELDHRVLNELELFQGRVPTAERIALLGLGELEKKIAGHESGARVVKFRVCEGDGLWVDVSRVSRRV